MPPKRHGRKRKTAKGQETADTAQERQYLRQKLEELQLYKPRMQMQEMRDLCTAIQHSMEEGTRQDEFEHHLNLTLQESMSSMFLNHQRTLSRCADHQQRAGMAPTSLAGTDLSELCPLLESTNNDTFLGEVSPPPSVSPTFKSPAVQELELSSNKSPNQPTTTGVSHIVLSPVPDVDSDSSDEYSPDNPGPCCRVVHMVQVEIHPEPRSDDDEERLPTSSTAGSQTTSRRLSNIEWDSIDEFI